MRKAIAVVGLTLFFVLGIAAPAVAGPHYPPSTPPQTHQFVPAREPAKKPPAAPQQAAATSSLPRTGMAAGALLLVGVGMVAGSAVVVRAARQQPGPRV